MPKIEGIEVNTTSILNCYRRYYPETYNQIVQKNRFHFLNLWGIRVSTCDTALPDDIIGGIRVNNFNFVESISAAASTDPSPKYVGKPISSNAARAGGTAFVKEGQYTYRYNGTRHPLWKPYPSFCPTKAMAVYRWNPSPQQIDVSRKTKKPLSSFFEEALKTGKVKLSTSRDTCIHRAWSRTTLFADSAGCQVFSDLEALNTLGKWANEHIAKKYGNIFVYTLFTKQQFVDANKGSTGLGMFKLNF